MDGSLPVLAERAALVIGGGGGGIGTAISHRLAAAGAAVAIADVDPDRAHAGAAQLPAGPVAAAIRHSGRPAVEAALRSFFAPRSRADGTVRMGVVFRTYLAERTR